MNIDFVIHPTFAQDRMSSNKLWHQYLDDLLKQVTGNECVILLKPDISKSPTDFEEKLKPLYILKTQSDYQNIPGSLRGCYREDTGFIVQEELKTLSELVNPLTNQKIKFHGSYFGYCLSEFVFQLYFLQIVQQELTLGKFREKWFSKEKNVDDKQVNFRKYAPKMPENYNWGVVFTIPEGIMNICPPGTNDPNKSINFPFGSIEYQLLCPQTKLYTLAPPNYS